MEIDFDFSNDKIKEYLSNKLEEIKCRNNELQLKLKERRMTNDQILDNNDGFNINCATGLQVGSIWTRLCHNTFVIGINTTFQTSQSSFSLPKDLKVLLHSTFNPIYKTYIFHKQSINCTCNDDCQHLTKDISIGSALGANNIILVAFPLPKFQNLSYKINCWLIYDYNGHRSLKLDAIELSINDIFAKKDFVQFSNFTTENFLSTLCTLKRTKLLLTLDKEWSRTIENTLEIYCSLTKINLQSICRQYFIANNISPLFDGSIIEVHHNTIKYKENSMFNVAIYSTNDESLHFFLHHLHRNIKSASFLPVDNCINYLPESFDVKEELLRVQKCLGEEMKLVYNFLGEKLNYALPDEESTKFREDLTNLEQETDLNYLKFSHSV